MNFNTLHEELEHLKQCKDVMSDESITHHCHECDGVFIECEMFKYQFKTNLKPQWHCKCCFKSLKDN